MSNKLTQKRLKELFYYKDGNLIRRFSSRWYKSGVIVGTIHKKSGYLQTSIDGKIYLNHRLIWLYCNGYFPENGIDHIDRNKLNNRIENLRDVGQICNMRNTPNQKNNTSGVKGITWHCKDKKWQCQIKVNKKTKYLGQFEDFDEAVCLRLAVEQCLNWYGCDKSSPAFNYVKKMVFL